MPHCDLSAAEQQRRKQLVSKTRSEIRSHMKIEDEDDSSLFAKYCGYFIQISFEASIQSLFPELQLRSHRVFEDTNL